MKKIITLFLATFLSFPLIAFAGLGVGVNLGKIEIDEPLKPGGIYNFPSIGVINTGDTGGEYKLAVSYHQNQSQLRPNQKWFSFNPSQFHLEPKAFQNVTVKLTLPIGVKPGDYFSYLEAHPITKTRPGTNIGIAAATKTYFTIAPVNIWQAAIWRVFSFSTIYAPWTYVVSAVIIAAIIIIIFKKFFVFKLTIGKKI